MKENIAFGFEFLRHILISSYYTGAHFFFRISESIVFIDAAILASK